MKIAIVGAGSVGTAIAYASAIQGVADEIVRYDLNGDAMATEKLAEGIRNFITDQIKLEQLIGSQ